MDQLRTGKTMTSTNPNNGQGPATAAKPQAAPKFEPTLVARLLSAHRTLNQRFADAIPLIERKPADGVAAVEECARQFSAVRTIETTLLYTVIAHAVSASDGVNAQFVELRLVGLMLSRRVQRAFDELSQAIRVEVMVRDAADRVAVALANYTRHSERAVYPLYELIGAERKAADAA
jgi:hypothetical protein